MGSVSWMEAVGLCLARIIVQRCNRRLNGTAWTFAAERPGYAARKSK